MMLCSAANGRKCDACEGESCNSSSRHWNKERDLEEREMTDLRYAVPFIQEWKRRENGKRSWCGLGPVSARKAVEEEEEEEGEEVNVAGKCNGSHGGCEGNSKRMVREMLRRRLHMQIASAVVVVQHSCLYVCVWVCLQAKQPLFSCLNGLRRCSKCRYRYFQAAFVFSRLSLSPSLSSSGQTRAA